MLTRRQATQRRMLELYRREVLDRLGGESAPSHGEGEDDLPELPPEELEEPLLETADVEVAVESALRESPPPLPEGGYGTLARSTTERER